MQKQKKQFGDYYIGLDIGTSSVGWAVTDLEYRLQKFNGKSMWGVRLFDEAQTAEERRANRTARRRTQRRVGRIQLLQELFAEEIAKKDFGFFLRLKESAFYPEDKTEKQPNAVFYDPEYTDKDYHEQYPTIYHLRRELMESSEPHDIRLVYLAVHHIIKHRGHFLYQGTFEDVAEMKLAPMLNELEEIAADIVGFSLVAADAEEIGAILTNSAWGVNRKKQELVAQFNFERSNKKSAEAMLALLAGGTAELKNLFEDDSLAECEQKKISFKGGVFEEHENKYQEALLDRFALITKLKEIYDWGMLRQVLGGESSLSSAKVKVYEQHTADLKLLKQFIREICPGNYAKIFGKPVGKEANYSAYIGTYRRAGKKYPIPGTCTQEDFCGALKKILPQDMSGYSEEYRLMAERINNNTFLPKQKTSGNGTIPYQIHQRELEQILNNASEYLPFLCEQDENGISVKDKIVSLLTFRIPYYVGPLNTAHEKGDKGFCWAVRKSSEPVRPWNFEEVIDVQASAKNFIRRMTNKCTYLVGEDVLPKDSLYYSSYMVLNELNNLRIHGEKIPVKLKQDIFRDLFMCERKVKRNRLVTYLKEKGYTEITKDDLSGFDGDFKSSMTSYLDFKKILDKECFTDKEKTMIEDMIQSIVLFGDDKKILSQEIKSKYGADFTEEQILKICNLKYSKWGNFSKALLTDVCDIDPVTGEYVSILSQMYNNPENPNFMHLMGNAYPYDRLIREKNGVTEINPDITYDDLENLYVSAPVKRGVWQTIQIVKELTKILGHEPKKIFVEVARGGGEKNKRTKSRKQQLQELYRNCGDDVAGLSASLELTGDEKLRKDKLFLYYLQLGRSMYSGKRIDLEDLDQCDIDHVYPQSKVMDDSLDNRVLVYKTENAKKGDSYPLSAEIQNAQRNYWNLLLKKELITKKKYDRLVRTSEFTIEEQTAFVSRQLVETQQSTKAVAALFGKMFGDTEVVYSKAGNVSEFRKGVDDFEKGHRKDEIDDRKKENRFVKVREINDLHHAKDAYLNIVVGNVFNTKFTSDPRVFFSGADNKYSFNAMYKFPVARGGVLAWTPTTNGKDGTMATVKRMMSRNDVLFTHTQNEFSGALFDVLTLKKGSGQVPRKGNSPLSDIDKYGGYNKASGAYFFLAEHTKKGKRVRTIETMMAYQKSSIDDRDDLLLYCEEKLGLKEPVIIKEKILFNALFELQGFRMHITGRTGDKYVFRNANPLIVADDDARYLKKLLNYAQNSMDVEEKSTEEQYGVSRAKNEILLILLTNKLKNSVYAVKFGKQADDLTKGKEQFDKLSVKDQCKVLAEILKFFQCNRMTSDLRSIGGVGQSGTLSLNKDITSMKNLYLVHQSVTGLFEQKEKIGGQ